MKVIVCGGRDNYDYLYIHQKLNEIHVEQNITVLVHGSATGVDKICDQWASYQGIDVKPYPADWQKLGKSAGPFRNRQMAHENKDAKCLVIFDGDRGTKDMVQCAVNNKIELKDMRKA